jgi:hypothetical protein
MSHDPFAIYPSQNPEMPSYRPSSFYYRDAIRRAQSLEECQTLALQAVKEIEHLKEWARELGLVPPRRFILSTEVEDKGLIIPPASPSPVGELVQFPEHLRATPSRVSA